MIHKKNLLAALLICTTFQLSSMESAPHKVSLLRALSRKIDRATMRIVTRTYSKEETDELLRERAGSLDEPTEKIEIPHSSTPVERDVTQWDSIKPENRFDSPFEKTPTCCGHIKAIGQRTIYFFNINKTN